ncbi:MAG: hypothetical protein E6Q32_10155 [Neisseriales bacterium]|nr:MAG: hypothetical protein E6Q32_10155 [Neisseriales bacterium]
MDVIHELTQSRLFCIFVSMSLGYAIGEIKFKKIALGSTIGTLIVAIILSCLGGSLDPKSEPIYFSIFLFAIGYDGGENIIHIFNRTALKAVALSIVMMLASLLSILLVMKFLHLSKGMAVGITAGALTQSAIIGSANDTVMSLTNLPQSFINQYNLDVTEGFSISYFFGVIGAIVWCSMVIEHLFKRSIRDDAIMVSHLIDEAYPPTSRGVSPKHTIFVLCNGLILGVLLGYIQVRMFGTTIKLGITGCLISGLLFGYINHKRPNRLVISQAHTKFLKDFGLSAFIAAIGLSSGSKVIQGIMHNGLDVIMASIIMTILPLFIASLVAYYGLQYKNIALLGGALAGARTASPASGVILHKAGNSVPMQSFMVPFILSSIFLTFLGPIIILFL